MAGKVWRRGGYELAQIRVEAEGWALGYARVRELGANHQGMRLRKGRIRFYGRNDDEQIEFTGENVTGHTPRDETVGIYTGNAFDLTGERTRANLSMDMGKSTATESFQIQVRNHKKDIDHACGALPVVRRGRQENAE